MSRAQRFRSAVTGWFVTKAKALRNPRTTVAERRDARVCLHAFTQFRGQYPEYVNATREANGDTTLTVRSAPQHIDGVWHEGLTANIVLSPKQVRLLGRALLK